MLIGMEKKYPDNLRAGRKSDPSPSDQPKFHQLMSTVPTNFQQNVPSLTQLDSLFDNIPIRFQLKITIVRFISIFLHYIHKHLSFC